MREQFNLAQAVEACVKLGVRAVAPWRDQVQAAGLKEAAGIVRANGLRVTGLCRGGMFTAADAAGRAAAIQDNKRAIDEACALGADCLVLVVGGLAQDLGLIPRRRGRWCWMGSGRSWTMRGKAA